MDDQTRRKIEALDDLTTGEVQFLTGRSNTLISLWRKEGMLRAQKVKIKAAPGWVYLHDAGSLRRLQEARGDFKPRLWLLLAEGRERGVVYLSH